MPETLVILRQPEITPEMVAACVATGERFAAAVSVLRQHLDAVLEICGDAEAYPDDARRALLRAAKASADMRTMDLGAWVARHAR